MNSLCKAASLWKTSSGTLTLGVNEGVKVVDPNFLRVLSADCFILFAQEIALGPRTDQKTRE